MKSLLASFSLTSLLACGAGDASAAHAVSWHLPSPALGARLGRRRGSTAKGRFMTTTDRIAAAATLACVLLSGSARADDLATMRAELDGLKAEYAARIATLEARIAELASRAAAAAPPAAPVPSRAGGGAAAFNPAIAVILAGTYAHLSEDPASYRIAGFMPGGGDRKSTRLNSSHRH